MRVLRKLRRKLQRQMAVEVEADDYEDGASSDSAEAPAEEDEAHGDSSALATHFVPMAAGTAASSFRTNAFLAARAAAPGEKKAHKKEMRGAPAGCGEGEHGSVSCSGAPSNRTAAAVAPDAREVAVRAHSSGLLVGDVVLSVDEASLADTNRDPSLSPSLTLTLTQPGLSGGH